MTTVPSAGWWKPWFVFVVIYAAYSVCYISKRSPSYWAASWMQSLPMDGTAGSGGGGGLPAPVADPTTVAAGMASAYESWGGVSKVAGGVLVDMFSASALLSGSMAAVAAAHAVLAAWPWLWAGTATTAVTLATFIWGGNGFVQAFAWPALARLFMDYFPDPATRGKWYAVLATSQNTGAAIAPPFLTYLTHHAHGSMMLLAPGIAAGACAAIIALLVSDKKPVAPPTPGTAPPAKAKPSVAAMLYDVLTSRSLWLLGTNYFFNSFLRNSFTEVPDFLLGRVDTRTKVMALSAYEFAAAAGGFAAGYISDRVFHGRRGPVMVLASAAATLVPTLAMMTLSQTAGAPRAGAHGGDATSDQASYIIMYAVLGATAFAPHMLNGLAAREVSHPSIQATAGGFTKALGQMGGALAGYPFITACAGQPYAFRWAVLAVVGLVATIAVIPLWNATAHGAAPVGGALVAPVAGGQAAGKEARAEPGKGAHGPSAPGSGMAASDGAGGSGTAVTDGSTTVVHRRTRESSGSRRRSGSAAAPLASGTVGGATLANA